MQTDLADSIGSPSGRRASKLVRDTSSQIHPRGSLLAHGKSVQRAPASGACTVARQAAGGTTPSEIKESL